MLGMFASNPLGLEGSVLQMINHGLSTGGLFLLVGIVYERRHTREIAQFGGLAHVMPVYATFTLIIFLASMGLPLLNGFIGEFMILLAAFSANPVWAYWAVSGVVLGAAYLLWLYQRVFWGKITHEENEHLADLNARELATLVPLVVLCFWIGLYPKPFLDFLHKPMGQLAAPDPAREVRSPESVARAHELRAPAIERSVRRSPSHRRRPTLRSRPRPCRQRGSCWPPRDSPAAPRRRSYHRDQRRRRDLLRRSALVVVLVLAFRVFEPFLLVFAVAGCVALLLAPLQRHLSRLWAAVPASPRCSWSRHHGRSSWCRWALLLVLLGQRALAFFAWIGPHLSPPSSSGSGARPCPQRFPGSRDLDGRLEGQLAPIVSAPSTRPWRRPRTALQRRWPGSPSRPSTWCCSCSCSSSCCATARGCGRPCGRCPPSTRRRRR